MLLIFGSSSEGHLPMTSAQFCFSTAWPLLSISIHLSPRETYLSTLLSHWHVKLQTTETKFFICSDRPAYPPTFPSLGNNITIHPVMRITEVISDSHFFYCPCPKVPSSLQMSMLFSLISPSLPPLPLCRPSSFLS